MPVAEALAADSAYKTIKTAVGNGRDLADVAGVLGKFAAKSKAENRKFYSDLAIVTGATLIGGFMISFAIVLFVGR